MKRSNKAVYLAQPNCGDVHEILNVSMIVMLDKIYQSVEVYAPKDCCDVLKQGLANLQYNCFSIRFSETRVYTKKQLPFWFICGVQELFCMLKNRKSDLFFSTLNFLWFPVFNMICFLLKGNMYTLCHNDMEHLINPIFGRVNIRWRLINYIFKKMSFSKNNYCLVLGESIKDNLFKCARRRTVEGNIIAMNHPYYSVNRSAEVSKQLKKGIIKIAIVGSIKNKDKNNIEQLNKALEGIDFVSVYCVSTSDFDLSVYSNIVMLNKENEHLPRTQYDELIAEMDALYFPYSSNTYRVSASGAVYEAISKQKPIISTKNDYFKSIFSQFGEMGYLFNDFDGLKMAFLDLQNSERIETFRKNAFDASLYLSPGKYYKVFEMMI